MPDVRVMSLVAAPGYGKTVLATRLFFGWQGPKLWYSLDAGDADLAAFAMHLDAMTKSLGTAQGLATESWRIGSPKEVGSLFAEAVSDVATSLLVVFDDVHVLRTSASHAALEELVERAARIGATFVLSGRSMPVQLHGFAAAAQLVALGTAELAFDEAEAYEYLRRVAPDRLDNAAIAAFARRAEGWPAGLALVASTARPGEELSDAASGSRPSASSDEARQLLFDYLATEALADLSADERDFLLSTSILTVLDVGLCNAALKRTDAAEMLAALARRGSFIVRRTNEAFTCHQLFRAFLRHTLQATRSRGDIAELHRRVAAALFRRGETAEAIGHLLEAGDVDDAATTLDAAVLSMLRMGLISRVAGLLERIDSERICGHPGLLMARGRLQRERGEWDAALGTLERAALAAKQARAFDVFTESLRISAPILASRGEFEQLLQKLGRALALGDDLPEESATTLRTTLAAVNLELQRYDDALAVFAEITPFVVARGDEAAQGLVLHNTAVAHLRRGDLYAGLALYERALKLKQNSGQLVSALLTLGDLVYTRMLLGDFDEAERLCSRLLDAAHDYGSSATIAHAHENQGMLRLQRDDWDGAERAFREAQRACDPGDVLILPDILHGLAQCALTKRRIEEADELCATAVGMFRGAQKFQQTGPILLTMAKARAERGDGGAAYAAASEAIDASARGADAVLQAMTCLDAAAFIFTLARTTEMP
ncbi:MAG: hypothetical protein JO060_09290, partial [Candidatus Eremiobacteraeota bacterium]|nr:hypothetical protein [Candidatus Eremiobacteraeota bacterium]